MGKGKFRAAIATLWLASFFACPDIATAKIKLFELGNFSAYSDIKNWCGQGYIRVELRAPVPSVYEGDQSPLKNFLFELKKSLSPSCPQLSTMLVVGFAGDDYVFRGHYDVSGALKTGWLAKPRAPNRQRAAGGPPSAAAAATPGLSPRPVRMPELEIFRSGDYTFTTTNIVPAASRNKHVSESAQEWCQSKLEVLMHASNEVQFSDTRKRDQAIVDFGNFLWKACPQAWVLRIKGMVSDRNMYNQVIGDLHDYLIQQKTLAERAAEAKCEA